MYRKLTTVAAVAALAFGLAACGGGGGDDTADAPTTMEPTGPTKDEQIAMLQEQINALRTQLGLAADDNLSDSVADLQSQVTSLQKQVQDAKDAEDAAAAEKMRMEMAAAGKALKSALGANPLATLDNTATALTTTLSVDQTQGTLSADPPAVTLRAGDSAGSLGDWAGMNYAAKNAGTGVSNSAVVYTNRAAPKTYPIATRYADTGNIPASGGTYAAGTGGKGTLTLAAASPDSNIKADMFPTAGEKTFTPAEGATEILVPGTYHGASGTYRCIGTCTATVTATGISLSDAWSFAHGAGAMVSVADANYLFFGWWLTKDKDDMPTAASAFTGTAGTAPTALTGVNAIVGSATYSGHAAGKYAINDPLNGGDAGHFTADATLTAKFSGSGAGITGTIDNFMANDKAVPWSVALNNRTFATGATEAIPTPGNNISETGAITSLDNTTVTPNVNDSRTTVWSIDGNAAPASGTWTGQMYDEAQGAATDGSNVPTTVLGRFQSEFGSTHSMVGAFGATKQ